MTWSLETSDGNESRKIKYEILPYVRGLGLDLGCGPWKVYPHVIGIDAQAYNSPGGPNFCGDVTALAMFADESMNFVYSSHTLEDQEDYAAVLAEWWRLVKVGGYLILYLPHKAYYPNIGQPGANPAHKHDFVPDDIIAAMRNVPGNEFDLLVNQERNDGNEYSFLQVYQKLSNDGGLSRESWREPRPPKMAAVVRYGAYGDALWASSILPQLKADGYHITMYVQETGEEVLRHDPHVDRIIIHSDYMTPSGEFAVFWRWEKKKYDRWINLTHSIEGQMLPAPHDPSYDWSDDARRAAWSHVNYLERVHQTAGVPYKPSQRFYPTDAEREWAKVKRAEFDGPVVVLQPMGSTWPKWWPYAETFAAMLAESGIHCVILGDYRGDPPKLSTRYGHFVGKQWTIRQAMAFAVLANVIVGEESALVNSAAYEAPLKIVLMSHSTSENLTRDWPNTIAHEPDRAQVTCYPCHRLHAGPDDCGFHKTTQSAACQAVALPGPIVELIEQYLAGRMKEAA